MILIEYDVLFSLSKPYSHILILLCVGEICLRVWRPSEQCGDTAGGGVCEGEKLANACVE